MKYPYIKYNNKVDIHPLFSGLQGDPLIVDMSDTSLLFNDIDMHDQKKFQSYLNGLMKGNFSWGVTSYMENRKKTLSQHPQMIKEKRYFHLGLDITVPLGTPLNTPLTAIVKKSGEPFAYIGDFHENGNWFFHTHFQILTQKAFDQGYISKGYCSAEYLAQMNSLCPSPLSLFKI